MISAAAVVSTATALGGSEAAAQTDALTALSTAAIEAVQARLLPGASPSEQTLLCAAACLALSWLAEPAAQSFTAGSFQFSRGQSGQRAAQFASLCTELLGPYAKASDFAFLGVEA